MKNYNYNKKIKQKSKFKLTWQKGKFKMEPFYTNKYYEIQRKVQRQSDRGTYTLYQLTRGKFKRVWSRKIW